MGIYRAVILYYLLIIFIQLLKASNKSIFIKKIFSSRLRDLIRLLINIELFQPIFFI